MFFAAGFNEFIPGFLVGETKICRAMIWEEAGCFWVNERLDNFQSELAGAILERLAALEWFGGSCLEWGKSLVKTGEKAS